jgi:hypothetical protein
VELGRALPPPACYAGLMSRIIRRTLIITIHEQWTFVWTPEQTNDKPVEEEAASVLPAPAEIVQQLRHLLGLSTPMVSPADSSIQLSIQYPDKESTDEETHV